MFSEIFYALDFIFFRFFVITTITVFSYVYISKNAKSLDKLLFAYIYSLFYIYSGVGASFSIVPNYYIIMYISYIVIFTIVYKNTFTKKFTPLIKESQFENIINSIFNCKKTDFFIYGYLLIVIIDNLYPDFNFNRLFTFVKPTLDFSIGESPNRDILQSLLYYCILFIKPFYFISIYKHRQKPIKFFILVFSPLFLSYTLGGYVARSTIVPYILIFIFTIYKYNVSLRKAIVYGSMISFVPFLVFLYNYSRWRLGASEIDVSIQESILLIIYQEISYPWHFEIIYNTTIDNQIIDFFKWLLTLPIPSFVKGNALAIHINYEFTELITNKSRFDSDFSVLLPGIITEGYLIFGKFLFFFMPLISGKILGYLHRLINSSERFYILKFYFVFMIMIQFIRAGANSGLANAINAFLFFYILLWYIKSKNKPEYAKH